MTSSYPYSAVQLSCMLVAMNREPTVTVTVRLQVAIVDKLQARARELRRSRSSVAAEAIERLLGMGADNREPLVTPDDFKV